MLFLVDCIHGLAYFEQNKLVSPIEEAIQNNSVDFQMFSVITSSDVKPKRQAASVKRCLPVNDDRFSLTIIVNNCFSYLLTSNRRCSKTQVPI